MRPTASPPTAKQAITSFFFAGLLPVIAFTIIEENYGTIPGLIAGLIFGAGEIVYEWFRYRQVSKLTWFGNGLLISLGLVSLLSSEGIWFKLQPALMEGIFGLVLWGSLLMKKTFLQVVMELQGQNPPEILLPRLRGLTFRLGLFFGVHAGLATWAAFDWSTQNWALLKGLGFTISFIIYFIFEGLGIRRSLVAEVAKRQAQGISSIGSDRSQ